MMNNFLGELQWRGMIHSTTNGVIDQLNTQTTAYVGIDPTADSLHIGHLVSIMMLKHFQLAGHIPIILIGGATAMIGDPSGKSKERNLLDTDTIYNNQEQLKIQLSKFLDFDNVQNKAIMVNNSDWMKDFSFLDFIRDIGKYITVNYMMAKESVKKRLNSDSQGMSFTEFTYQLVQGYDFLYLHREYGCKLQMGGSDQYGNMTTGMELISKIDDSESFAITCPLITKDDGTKFGKTESGNIWLDAEKTTPYKFYQFWLNTSDVDAQKYIKIFTLLSESEINLLIQEHNEKPELRLIQRKLAEKITSLVHGEEKLQSLIDASNLLFGVGTIELLSKFNVAELKEIMVGVPMMEIKRTLLTDGIKLTDLLVDVCGFFKSKGDVRKLIQSNGISINKNKIQAIDHIVDSTSLLNNQYILIQKGRRDYYLIYINE